MPSQSHFPLRAFFGHHKCATGWIDTILMDVCFHMGLHIDIVHREVDFGAYDRLADRIQDRAVDLLSYTNAKTEHVSDLPLHRGFHVVRDPRDVLVSAYFSHLHSHPTDNWPELADHREQLADLSKDEGLFCEMDFSAEVFDDMYRWDYSREDVLELKMESLTANPIEVFAKVFAFLGMLDDGDTQGLERMMKTATLTVNRLLYKGRRMIPTAQTPKLQTRHTIPDEKLQAIVRKNSFDNLSGGRDKGEENVESHYRKGVPGDWVNHFTAEHKRVFKERFNDVLIQTGYEDDDAW
jgi:hypothetical protein